MRRGNPIAGALFAAVALFSWGPRAAANGAELLPGGTRAVARGGAVAARPDDPMLMVHNPAGLALLSGQAMLLNVDVPLHEMCFDPYGYYGWGVYDDGPSEFGRALEEPYATTPLPEVCNSAPTFGIPNIAWAGKFGEDFALAAGFVAPTLMAGAHWGGEDGTIQVGDRALPTPTRYQLIRQEALFALAPSVSAAYRVLPQLAVGVTLQVAMLRVRSHAVQNLEPGTQPVSDWYAELTAEDYFLPSLTFSVHSKPLPQLDLVAAFRWADTFSGPGKAQYVTNTFTRGNQNGPVPAANEEFGVGRIDVPLPWALTVGARYAGLLEGEPRGLGDPMDTELWDVELDVTYNLNERTSQNTIHPAGDATVYTRRAVDGQIRTGSENVVDEEDLSSFTINRHQKDSWAVRLGGSYSLAPRVLALHAGGFFETRAVEPAYASIDSFAFQRVGAGLGVVWRVGAFDLVASYAHIFSEELEVAPPPHEAVEDAVAGDPTSGFDKRVGGTLEAGVRTGGMVLEDPAAPSPSEADGVAALRQTVAVRTMNSLPERVINAGKYTASFDIISIGAVYHW